jgi:hypothetical protein
MIIARSAGRLGNQLFVFSALEKIRRPEERLLLFGFKELEALLPESKSYRFVKLKRAKSRRWKWLESALRILASFGLVGLLTHDRQSRSLNRSRGIFRVSLFSAGFCIDDRLLDLETIRKLSEIFRSSATTSFALQQDHPNLCFIHIRRGDFLSWPHPNRPAALPERWYVENSQVIKAQKPDCHFLVFSDDETFGKHIATIIEDATYIEESDIATLGLMSHCTGGVLSAGTYSWWGARLASLDTAGPFIAPNYWIGWRDQDWGDHEEIKESDFIRWESGHRFL